MDSTEKRSVTKLTIGMPVYNSEEFIGSVLDCLLGQTYGNFRLVIADNGSTDGTEEICRDYSRLDRRIDYLRHQDNLGATRNYNFVAEQADTDYFKWHSSNDLLSHDALEKCVSVLEERPDAVLVFPATICFESSPDAGTEYQDDPEAEQENPVERFLHVVDTMHLNNIMNGVLRLDALRRTGMLREFFYADRNMMAELALQGKILRAGDCAFFRRMDEKSATKMKSEKEVLEHFDPSWKRPLPFPTWRIFSSYWYGLWASGIGSGAALKGSLSIARRAWWQRHHLSNDVAEFARFAFYDQRRRRQG